MKVVAAALIRWGGVVLGAAAAGSGTAGAGGCRGRPRGAGFAMSSLRTGLGLGLGLAAGWDRGTATGLGGGLALVLGFGQAAGAGFTGVRRRPAWPVAGSEAAGALAVAGAPAVGIGLGGRLRDFFRSLGGVVLDEDVVLEADDMLVVVEVVESEAEETDVGNGEGSRTTGVGAGCWVLWVMRTRVPVRASAVCARFPWCPVCVPVLVLWVVS